MKKQLLVILSVLAIAAAGRTATIVAAVDLKPANTLLTSKGSAQYYDNSGNAARIQMKGEHAIVGADGNTIAAQSISTTEGYWLGTLTAQGRSGVCYRASLNLYAGTVSQGMGSGRMCYPAPPPTSEPPPQYPTTSCTNELGCTGGPRSGSSGGSGVQTLASDQCYYDVWYGSLCDSPLVVSLDNSPYRFSGADAAVLFDLTADGNLDLVTWTQAGAQVGFVTLDRNGNGTIDSGAELFGNHTPRKLGGTASDGFNALADFDINLDSVIDANDPIWPYLRLWVDSNHNGLSEPDELLLPVSAGITAFGLDHHFTARHDGNGNVLRFKGECIKDGHPRPYYDVYFRLLP